MPRLSHKITAILCTFGFFSASIVLPTAQAQATPAEAFCQSTKPDFAPLAQKWVETKSKTYSEYQKAFEKAQEEYHEYIGCLVEYIRATVLKETPKLRQGISQANTPNLPWMSPAAACLKEDELKRIMDGTAPQTVLEPALNALSSYKAYLEDLKSSYSRLGVLEKKGSSAKELSGKLQALNAIQRQTDAEVESALVALDISFGSLKELRGSLVMHVHLQCLLNSLEKQRKVLASLRRVMEGLPRALRDASMSKN